MLACHVLAALLFAVLGIVFFCGKGSFLIAGYNTSSPGEKAQYDEKALCRAMGGLMLALAACFVIMVLSEVFQIIAFLWIGLALLFVNATGGAIYMNASKKIKRK